MNKTKMYALLLIVLVVLPVVGMDEPSTVQVGRTMGYDEFMDDIDSIDVPLLWCVADDGDWSMASTVYGGETALLVVYLPCPGYFVLYDCLGDKKDIQLQGWRVAGFHVYTQTFAASDVGFHVGYVKLDGVTSNPVVNLVLPAKLIETDGGVRTTRGYSTAIAPTFSGVGYSAPIEISMPSSDVSVSMTLDGVYYECVNCRWSPPVPGRYGMPQNCC